MRALSVSGSGGDIINESLYLMLVTHNVQHEFPEGSQDWRKISDRFHQPFCEITLPENIAFRLLGSAMENQKIRWRWKNGRM